MKVLNLFSKRNHCGLSVQGIGAQQHFKDDCDLNRIIKKYPDGVLPQPHAMPTYGDFTAIGKGLQDSMNALQFVSDWFASLPSEVRARFDNDPLKAQKFVLSDPDGSVKLGILALKVAPQERAEGAQPPKEKGGVAVEPPATPAATKPEGVTE